MLATCNRVEVYADTEGFHAGVDAVSDLLSRAAPACRSTSSSESPLRPLGGPGRPAPVPGRLRARLDGRRRVADPRPAAPGVRRGARRRRRPRRCTSCSRRRSRSASGRTARPASTRPAARWSPSGSSGAVAAVGPLAGRDGAGRRRRLDGRAGRRDAAPRRRRRASSSPTAPPSNAPAARRARSRAAAIGLDELEHGAGRAPTSSCPRPARPASSSTPTSSSGRSRPAAAGRSRSSTSRCPRDIDPRGARAARRHARRPRGAAGACSPTTEAGADVEAARAIVDRGGRATSSPGSARAGSRRPSWRCAAGPTRSSRPSSTRLAGRLPDLDAGAARRGRRPPCAGSSTSCCTPRPCG